MSQPSRSRVWIAQALISLAFITAIMIKVGPGRIVTVATQVHPVPLLLAVALGIPRFAAKIARWRVLASRAIPRVGWSLAARSLLVGTAGAVITPGRVGQAASSLVFPQGSRLILSGMALADPLADLAVAVILVAFYAAGPVGGCVALIASSAAAIGAPRLGRAMCVRGGRVRILGEALERLDMKTIALVGLLSMVIYGCNLIQFHVLLRAHGPIPLAASAASLPFIFLAVACPITIAGFGLREATAALVLARYGVDAGIAIRSSFELFVINLLLPGLAGAGIAGRLGIRIPRRLPGQPNHGDGSSPADFAVTPGPPSRHDTSVTPTV